MNTPYSPYTLMQMAVDIVNDSPHPTNKIAATLAGTDNDGLPFHISRTNFWPPAIEQAFGHDTRIGGSSGTVHAEMACVLAAPRTRDASVFVTDPPCPNCMKYMAEAGVKTLYIDHKGFDKDFALRHGDDFQHMSLRICQRAGISVYKIHRKEETIETILQIAEEYRPPIENPAVLNALSGTISQAQFLEYTETLHKKYGSKGMACAVVSDHAGMPYILSANVHPVIGYTSGSTDKPDGKYSFTMQPLNRILTNAARKGLRIHAEFIWSSRVPTARELVNMIGAGFNKLMIGDITTCRDEDGLKALAQLVDAGIFTVL